MRMEDGEWNVGNVFRTRSVKLARRHWIGLLVFAVGFMLLGSDKSPLARMIQHRVAGRGAPITENDIVRGYRVADLQESEGPRPMPDGSITNEPLRLRGGYDWAFRVERDDWSFPTRDGIINGVTVLARGEVRPDVGRLYFPVPITNGVSLLPQSKWGLLPNGGGSVFSHAVTNDSLLLDWHNALVDRDPNSPTNLQLELRGDGSFVWRTDDASTSYLPVLPFDWDGDGLENSVDPEPLLTNPIDAHGTSTEWYSIVCSNVFEIADNSNIETFHDSNIPEGIRFKPEVNSNAYYFVDVVAERGPAPIQFCSNLDDTRLGSPVVVALQGVTNHVPLFMGATYTVNSTVPFSVALPENGFAELTWQTDHSCTIRWPIDFEFTEDGMSPGTYTVQVVPYDPGGTFTWNNPSSGGGGAMLMSTEPRSSCGCWSGLGPRVTFGCSSSCGCGGGCQANGTFRCDSHDFPLSGGSCSCTNDDGEDDDDHPPPEPPPPDPLVGGLSITFSDAAVIFEDEYRNMPGGPLVPRKSTTTYLTISASGGTFGGSFTLTPQNLEKLASLSGGAISLPSAMSLEPFETYQVTFACKGVAASGAANDVKVNGLFLGGLPASTEAPSAETTVVQVELEAVYEAPENTSQSRHVYGVGEQVQFTVTPALAGVTLSVVKGDVDDTGVGSTPYDTFAGESEVDGSTARIYTCPIASTYVPDITISYSGAQHKPTMEIVEPNSVITPRAEWDGGCFPWGTVGEAGLYTYNYIGPMHVSFQGIAVSEIPCDINDAIPPTGHFTNRVHGLIHGISEGAGVAYWIKNGNFWAKDNAGSRGPEGDDWSPGTLNWRIPIGWHRKSIGASGFQLITEPDYERMQTESSRPLLIGGGRGIYLQTREILSDGTYKSTKFGHWITRGTWCRIILDGSTIQWFKFH